MDDVGVFRTTIEVQNWELRGPSRTLPATVVDTGSEYTWIPRRVLDELGIRAHRTQAFEVADGPSAAGDQSAAPREAITPPSASDRFRRRSAPGVRFLEPFPSFLHPPFTKTSRAHVIPSGSARTRAQRGICFLGGTRAQRGICFLGGTRAQQGICFGETRALREGSPERSEGSAFMGYFIHT
jgi:hypothetical protein